MGTSSDLVPLKDDFSSVQLFAQTLQFFESTAEGKQTYKITKAFQTAYICVKRDLFKYLLSSTQLHFSH